MLQNGMVLNNRYQILHFVGKGGMSTVYKARDLVNQTILAVKEVTRTNHEAGRVMEDAALKEGRMLMHFSHPNIPRMYDIIEEPDSYILVMDFVEGESLDQVIAREGAQPVDKVLKWGMQICDVFDYLHNQRPRPIIYRDMKPANLMLRPNGDLMLVDFGTARTHKDKSMKEDTVCLGTVGFAAPEQFGGLGESDSRTDIFCLGATLNNMITGHNPSDPGGMRPIEYWIPSLANTPIAEIVAKCTRQDPNMRYQTAAELREDLHLAGIGGYKLSGTRGKSGPLSGSLRKNEWQKQDNTTGGLLSGLSGLLGKKSETPPAADVPPQVEGHGWQKAPDVPVIDQLPYVQQNEVYQEQYAPENDIWRKLMLIGAILAGVFVLLTMVLIVLNILAAAIVFLMIAMGAAALALVGLFQSRKVQ